MMRRSGSAAAVAILLIGVAIAGGWWLLAPSLLGAGGPALDGPLASAAQAPAAAGVSGPAPATGSFQTAQPRDPFRPLITETSPTGTEDGGTGTYEPSGTRVRLIAVTEVGGVLRATVQVDSTTYDVGEGETFADSFMVVSLDTDSGVFLYGDNAFELSVGQEILK
jgi:hypothetical protein